MRGGSSVSRERLRFSVALFAIVVAFVFAGATSAAAATPAWSAHGSVEQVYVTGLAANQPLTLLTSAGKTVATQNADAQGGLLFRNVKPGSGYKVKAADGTTSGPLTVLTTQPAPPGTSVYAQSIPSRGYGYLTTRDGTQLAINVHPPQDVADALPTGGAGPDRLGALPPGIQLPLPPPPVAGVTAHPTLIEYSGYGYADPAGPQNGI